MVDEYQTEFQLPQETSRRPLSLRQLIRFLDSVEHPGADAGWKRFGFVLSYNEFGISRASVQIFTRSLDRTYACVMEEWYSGHEQTVEKS